MFFLFKGLFCYCADFPEGFFFSFFGFSMLRLHLKSFSLDRCFFCCLQEVFSSTPSLPVFGALKEWWRFCDLIFCLLEQAGGVLEKRQLELKLLVFFVKRFHYRL